MGLALMIGVDKAGKTGAGLEKGLGSPAQAFQGILRELPPSQG